jgi:hypothetical protein
MGSLDIMVTTRANTLAAFGALAPVANVNTDATEAHPHVTEDGTAGAVPLFHLSHANGDQLYLTSEAESDQAIAICGFVLEGTIGYAWPTA